MKQLLLFTLILSSTCISFSADMISLEDYLQRLETENLDLKTEQAVSDSLQARSSGLGIPAPMIGILQMKDQDGSSATGFEINQTVPFPSKITGDHKLRKKDFQYQQQIAQMQRSLTRASAKLIYFKLWQSQQRLEFLQEKKDVIKDHIKISRSAARSNSFAAIHILKSESDLDFLENEIEMARQNIREKQIDLALFINADPAVFTLLARKPELSLVPKNISIEESSFYRAKQYQVDSLEAKESLAKSAWLPDFNLKYKEVGATNTSMANKEIMLGITLPFVFFWEPNSATQQAHQERLGVEYTMQKEKKFFIAKKALLLSRTESLKKQLSTINNNLIPRAVKRMKLVHNIVLRDMETLQDHLETMQALPELKMKALDLRAEYEQTIAELEKYNSKSEP